IEVEGTGIRVSLPGKHEARLTALAQRGRLAFREVVGEPQQATGTGAVDADEARKLRQSQDLLAAPAKSAQAITRALAVLSCDGGNDPLAAEEDPALPLVTCEQKPAEGGVRMAYVLGPEQLDNSAIQSARARQSPTSVGFEIMVNFTSEGEAQWSDLTGRVAQETQARGTAAQVAFVLDTAVISAPQVTQRIEGDTVISGDFTPDEAEAIAGVLTTQPLPLAFEVTDLRVVRSGEG
ncbi:MAG: SecDF P1 head subdomain-containing protein, partial [Gammaproteobacteria bacterium]